MKQFERLLKVTPGWISINIEHYAYMLRSANCARYNNALSYVSRPILLLRLFSTAIPLAFPYAFYHGAGTTSEAERDTRH